MQHIITPWPTHCADGTWAWKLGSCKLAQSTQSSANVRRVPREPVLASLARRHKVTPCVRGNPSSMAAHIDRLSSWWPMQMQPAPRHGVQAASRGLLIGVSGQRTMFRSHPNDKPAAPSPPTVQVRRSGPLKTKHAQTKHAALRRARITKPGRMHVGAADPCRVQNRRPRKRPRARPLPCTPRTYRTGSAATV